MHRQPAQDPTALAWERTKRNALPGDILCAMHKYAAKGSDELSLTPGHRLQLTERTNMDGWFRGRNLESGESGLFPGTYTVLVYSGNRPIEATEVSTPESSKLPNSLSDQEISALRRFPKLSVATLGEELDEEVEEKSSSRPLSLEATSRGSSQSYFPAKGAPGLFGYIPLPSYGEENHRGNSTVPGSDLWSSYGTAQRQFDRPVVKEEDEKAKSSRLYGLNFMHDDYQEACPNLFEVVDSHLGFGSLGVVEEVRVSSRYSSFVRKRIQIDFHKPSQYLNIIKQEAQALRKLSHSHIVKLIGSYSEVRNARGQFYYFLMVPVGERALKTFLGMVAHESASNSADWCRERVGWLRKWLKCLSSALAYIHSQGIRHEDIKPSNIIHRGETIYFTDFGSAKQFQTGQTTSTESPAQTSCTYAAPEIVNDDDGTARHGLGTDVFALGIVFTEMLAVMQGFSVNEYQDFLRDPTGRRPAPARQNRFLYAKKLKEIEEFFAIGGLEEKQIFQKYVRSMLSPDRSRRPKAKDVATQIRISPAWLFSACSCDEDSYDLLVMEPFR